MFTEYAETLYGAGEDDSAGAEGIESGIEAEIAGMQKPEKVQLFVPVKLEVQCGEFLVLRPVR